MDEFKAVVSYASKELTRRERLMMSDMGDALSLDKLTQERGAVVIMPSYYAVVSVHNPKAQNPDYEVMVIVDTEGTKYFSGSPTFRNNFSNIVNEMAGEEEPWGIKVFRRESKNFRGKDFITCTIC